MKHCAACLIILLATLVASGLPAAGPGGIFYDSDLDATEAASLVHMRDEEKLARDTYLTLYDRWGEPVFATIAESEQRHMDAMLTMLVRYGIDDPVPSDDVGVFGDESFTTLFSQLVSRGEQSLLDAYYTGAYIEELDIGDLREAISATDEQPLVNAYTNLLAGSRNHLRAFVAHIVALGYDYEAQLLDQADVDEIVGDFPDVIPNEGFTMNSGLTDTWFYPAMPGQGFFISVFPDSQQVFLAWFTFDTELPAEGVSANLGDAGQRWLTAQGKYVGDSAELAVYSSSGGIFDSAQPEPVHDVIGSILLQFDNCSAGSVIYDLPTIDRAGVVPIERVAPDNVTNCQRNNQPASN
ncbi:MAG: DUF2202 domain-containing protein [Lysobacterales bacterium]|jgi:hypothetical protein